MSTAKRDPNQSKSGKAPTFQIRITPELKAQFEAAAKAEFGELVKKFRSK